MIKRLFEDRKYSLLAIGLCWMLWWILAATRSYLESLNGGSGVLKHELIDYTYVGIIWMIATPIVIFFAKRISEIESLKSVIALHFIGALFILFIRTVPYTYLTITHAVPQLNFMQNWMYIIKIQLLGNFIIYTLIVSSYHALRWYVDFKESELLALQLDLKSSQLEQKLSEANLRALRMQLNPHFLFNTLHSVASLIRIKKNEDAIETLSKLSEMLRSTIYGGNANEVTIQEELLFLEKYLDIEQMRFSHRLQVHWNLDKEVLDCTIPKLLLQPLVENSLKHGLQEADYGSISITIKKTAKDRIFISIDDTGVGLPADFDLSIAGIGLQNTLDRLKGTYGNKFKFNIRNHPSMRGVQVNLKIPVNNDNTKQ